VTNNVPSPFLSHTLIKCFDFFQPYLHCKFDVLVLHNGTALGCYIYYFHDIPYLWSFYVFCVGMGVFLVGLIIMAFVDVWKSRDEDLPPDDSEGEEEEDAREHSDVDDYKK